MEDLLPNTSRTINSIHTPRTRIQQHFSLGVSSDHAVETEAGDTLEALLHQTWTIFGVSALFNFHQDEFHLKQYAKRLREEVASNLTQEDVSYTTEICVMNDISIRPSPMDSIPIKVEVFAEKNTIEESTKKCIYKGVFLSWRTIKNTLTPGSVRYPLLLCRGTRSAIAIVHNVLRRMFDCIITALHVGEDDLIWLILIVITPMSEEDDLKNTDEICMEYKIPELSDTITIKFCALDLMKILTVLLKDQSDEASHEICFHLEQIEKFREILYKQVLDTAGLQLQLCSLCKINLPTFTIMENRMKVMNTYTMNRVLLYLNEKSVDILHTINFEVQRL